MSAINILLQRNAAFAEQRFTPNLPLATTLGITVIGCVDPRVDPAHVLGIERDPATGASYISFYDPDGIAWELYALPPR